MNLTKTDDQTNFALHLGSSHTPFGADTWGRGVRAGPHLITELGPKVKSQKIKVRFRNRCFSGGGAVTTVGDVPPERRRGSRLPRGTLGHVGGGWVGGAAAVCCTCSFAVVRSDCDALWIYFLIILRWAVQLNVCHFAIVKNGFPAFHNKASFMERQFKDIRGKLCLPKMSEMYIIFIFSLTFQLRL